MSGLFLPGSVARERAIKPSVPHEIADAVEKWARRFERHARIDHVVTTSPPTPQVRLTPRPGDPALEKVQTGEWKMEDAEEIVHLWEWDEERRCYVGVPLSELGVRGVIEWLDEGNTWTGRGRFDSLQDAVDYARTQKEKGSRKFEREVMQDVRDIAKDVKHQVLGIPKRRVGIDLSRPSQKEPATTGDET